MAVLLMAGTAAFGVDNPPATDPVAAAPAADAAAPPPVPVEAAPAPEAADTAPVPASAAPAPATGNPSAGPVTPEQLQAEVCALREDMRMLQSTLDLMVNKIMADLREENELLRDEVRRLNVLRGEQGLADINAVPRPGGAAVEQALLGPTEKAAPPPPPFKFTVVREWGRTAEEAQKLGGEAQSLKGLIGVVPAGSLRGDVENLARELRRKYDGFDNINIEVFDDPLVANQFAANRAADPEHRVLSVSRHKASNRDAIVLLTGGRGEMISADPNEPPPPRQPDDMPTLSVTNPVAPGQAERAKDIGGKPSGGTASSSGQNPPDTPEPPPAPGQWVKSGKKKHVGESSKKTKEEPVPTEGQNSIPEGPPVLVPHLPDPGQSQIPPQPETKVYEAPPGVPVEQPAPLTDAAVAAPEESAGATAPADTDQKAEVTPDPDTKKPPHNPKNPFGPTSKKTKKSDQSN